MMCALLQHREQGGVVANWYAAKSRLQPDRYYTNQVASLHRVSRQQELVGRKVKL